MFGNKNKENIERIENLEGELLKKDQICQALQKSRKNYEANKAELEEAFCRVEADLSQFQGNLDEAGALFAENEKNLSKLQESLAEDAKTIARQKENEGQLVSGLDKLFLQTQETVENNKHFTGPSKALSDFADSMKRECQDEMRQLRLMEEYSKQMGVLSLNAAIEAGRMGESGKEFVASCENVRTYSIHYDQAVQTLLQKQEKQQEQVALMAEEVQKLIGLMKDSNVAISKLMKEISLLSNQAKKGQENDRQEACQNRQVQTAELLDRAGELSRMEERNRLQLTDVKEEVKLLRQDNQEIFDTLDQVYEDR